MRTNTLTKRLLAIGTSLFLAALIAGPFTANAQPAGQVSACSNLANEGLKGVVVCLSSLFQTIIYLIMAASVVYVVWGAFLMIRSEEKREEGKQIIYHGIIGLFVMISIWGLVSILDNTFNLSKVGPRNPPELIKLPS
jgi:hypothetical protein